MYTNMEQQFCFKCLNDILLAAKIDPDFAAGTALAEHSANCCS